MNSQRSQQLYHKWWNFFQAQSIKKRQKDMNVKKWNLNYHFELLLLCISWLIAFIQISNITHAKCLKNKHKKHFQRDESYILDLLTCWWCCHEQCKNFTCICYHQDINHSHEVIELKMIWYWATAIIRDDEKIDCNNSSFNLVIEQLHSFSRKKDLLMKLKSSSSSQFIADTVYSATSSSMLSLKLMYATTSDSLICTL